jgi:hypothetical protein
VKARRAARRGAPFFSQVITLAKELDTLLEQRLGRVYHWIMITSIVGGLGQSFGHLFSSPLGAANPIGFGAVGAVGIILLIHQVAELGDRVEKSRMARRGGVSQRDTADARPVPPEPEVTASEESPATPGAGEEGEAEAWRIPSHLPGPSGERQPSLGGAAPTQSIETTASLSGG